MKIKVVVRRGRPHSMPLRLDARGQSEPRRGPFPGRVFRPENGKTADPQGRSRCVAFEILATLSVVRSDDIQSAANLAALMAPEDQKSMYLQRLGDSNFRRLSRLISALGKVRRGGT